jgi:siroheme synthase
VDTLVILMGARSLPAIVRALLAAGRAPGTPVALIQRGTTEAQETVVGRLDEIAALAAVRAVASPVVIVVGDVVALRDEIAWRAASTGRRAVAGSDQRVVSLRRLR